MVKSKSVLTNDSSPTDKSDMKLYQDLAFLGETLTTIDLVIAVICGVLMMFMACKQLYGGDGNGAANLILGAVFMVIIAFGWRYINLHVKVIAVLTAVFFIAAVASGFLNTISSSPQA